MSVIRKPFELKVQPYVKALIYGQPGVRKTTFGLSAPAPLLLDADNGVHRVETKFRTDTVQIDSWEDVQAVLAEDLSAYKTIVVDTAGKLIDFMSAHLIKEDPKLGGKNGSLTLQGYGARKSMFINFLKQVTALKKHLIFIAHEKEDKEGDQKIIRPEIGGSSGGDLIKELDLVGYMQSIGQKKTISFEPCEKFYGKNTCSLPAIIDLQRTLEENKSNNQLTGIIDLFAKTQEERTKIAAQYKELMDVTAAKVDAITNAATANDAAGWAAGYATHVWDSKYQAAVAINRKAKELGLSLNNDKKYIGADGKTGIVETKPVITEAAAPVEAVENGKADSPAVEADPAAGAVPNGNSKPEKKRNSSSKKKTNAEVKQGELV